MNPSWTLIGRKTVSECYASQLLRFAGRKCRPGVTAGDNPAGLPAVAPPGQDANIHEDAEMKPAIATPDPATAERCDILELSNVPDDPDCSIARASVAPSVTTRWHALNGTAGRYVILQGRGRVEIGELAPQEVGPGDVVRIPPGCRQRIANAGAGELVFLAICTPRFRPEAYEDLEAQAAGMS